jgi:hypothetical protein
MLRSNPIPGVAIARVPSRAKEILAKCKTSEEIDLECALWSVDILDTFRFKPIPMAPSVISTVVGEDRASAFTRSVETARLNPEATRYYELKRKIQVENSGGYDWLKRCREILLTAGRPAEAQRIKDKLDTVKEEQLYILKEKGGDDSGSENFG